MIDKSLLNYLPSELLNQIDINLVGIADPQAKQTIHCIFHDDHSRSAVFFYAKANFYCSACNLSISLKQLIAKFKGVGTNDVETLIKIASTKNENNDFEQWRKHSQQFLSSFITLPFHRDGYSFKAFKEMQVGCIEGAYYSVPVIIDNDLIDIRSYYPKQDPKWKSQYHAPSGMIVGYDLWIKDDRPTYLCAGEKDMLIARSKGLNAICITGGENCLPKFVDCWKDKTVYVLYDNDDTGHQGGKKLAKFLFEHGAKVKNITAFHQDLEEKGDLYDWLTNPNHTVTTLNDLIDQTPWFSKADTFKQHEYLSLFDLRQDKENAFSNKHWTSNIQCVLVEQDQYSLPISATVTKITKDMASTGGSEFGQQVFHWKVDFEKEPDKLLKLFNNLSRTKDIGNALCASLGVKWGQKQIAIQKEANFYRGKVRPFISSQDFDRDITSQPEYDFISCEPLETSKIYQINFVPISNDFKIRTKELAIYEAKPLHDYSNFKLTDEAINYLKVFQSNDLPNKVTELYNRACDPKFLSPILERGMWEFFELVFCSPLEYKINGLKYRAGLHACAIGDSQVGKSTTLERMIAVYKRGIKTNAKTATMTGLIGGSDKTANGRNVVKAGELVLNHRGLIGLEEIHGQPDYYRKITEIKSSGRVKITRVNDTSEFSCLLRIIEIANPPSGTAIVTYDNCYQVIKELIHQPEDIGRVDLYGVFANTHIRDGTTNAHVSSMFEPQAYVTRINWIWSRNADQVKFICTNDEFQKACDAINTKFELDAPIFGGQNTMHRLLRIACAYAGMLVSSDDTFENIVVTNDHLKLAVNYLINTYSKPPYDFDKATQAYRQVTTFHEDDVAVFKELLSNERWLLQEIVRLGTIKHQRLMLTIHDRDQLSEFYQKAINRSWIKEDDNTKNGGFAWKATTRLKLLITHLKQNGLTNNEYH